MHTAAGTFTMDEPSALAVVRAEAGEDDDGVRVLVARAEADELRGLPAGDAARRIEAKHTEQEHARRRAAQRARQRDPFERDRPRTDPGREGPARTL